MGSTNLSHSSVDEEQFTHGNYPQTSRSACRESEYRSNFSKLSAQFLPRTFHCHVWCEHPCGETDAGSTTISIFKSALVAMCSNAPRGGDFVFLFRLSTPNTAQKYFYNYSVPILWGWSWVLHIEKNKESYHHWGLNLDQSFVSIPLATMPRQQSYSNYIFFHLPCTALSLPCILPHLLILITRYFLSFHLGTPVARPPTKPSIFYLFMMLTENN